MICDSNYTVNKNVNREEFQFSIAIGNNSTYVGLRTMSTNDIII